MSSQRTFPFVWLISLFGAGSVLGSLAHAEVVYRTITVTGNVAPGTGGLNFSSLLSPVIDPTGQVAFIGELQLNVGGVSGSNNSGVWSTRSGSLALVLREGGQAPGTPTGAVFGHMAAPLVDANGRIAFWNSLQTGTGGVTPNNNTGLWSEGDAGIALVVRRASPVPGAVAGTVFDSFDSFSFSRLGRLAFTAHFTGGDTTVTNNLSVWSQAAGPMAMLARTGDQAPDVPVGAVYERFDYAVPVIGSGGRTVFWAWLATTGGGVTDLTNDGIWAAQGAGPVALIAREGNPAIGAPAGVNFGNLGRPSVNSSGQIAFRADYSGGIGEWSNRTGTLAPVVSTGDAAPGVLAAHFSGFGDVYINHNGRTVFSGFVASDGVGITAAEDQGIWSDGGGPLMLVAREGTQAPGATAGALFSSFYEPVINANGQVAFRGILRQGSGGVTIDNDLGLWVQDGSGTLILLVREGDLFTVAPGDVRTVNGIFVSTPATGGDDGKSTWFSDASIVAFELGFTNGSTGIFAASVPEPGMIGMLAASGFLILGGRRRC